MGDKGKRLNQKVYEKSYMQAYYFATQLKIPNDCLL